MKQNQNNMIGERQRATGQSFGVCLLVLFIAVAATGCRHEPKVPGHARSTVPTSADINPVGNYALVTVDGSKVPCTLRHEGHTMTINSGNFIIRADGTCVSQMYLAGREAPIEVKATYTRQGPKLTMKWEGAGVTFGTVSGDTFTMNNEGMALAYRKQAPIGR